MRVLLLVFCALFVIGHATGARQPDSPASSLTRCDVAEISGDIKSIFYYSYTTLADCAEDLLDIAGNLIFCANSLLSWLCESDDWQATVESRWSHLQRTVVQFHQQVPSLWREIVQDAKSCF